VVRAGSEANYTARRFPPGAKAKGSALTDRGGEPPNIKRNASRKADEKNCAKDRHRMAETDVPLIAATAGSVSASE